MDNNVVKLVNKQYKPKEYLFEGKNLKKGDRSVPYSRESAQKVLKRAVKKAGIRRKVTLHTLRHSYATHLYEKGINLRSIQVLLARSSSKTTGIYTHVSNIHLSKTPNPIDFLEKSPN